MIEDNLEENSDIDALHMIQGVADGYDELVRHTMARYEGHHDVLALAVAEAGARMLAILREPADEVVTPPDDDYARSIRTQWAIYRDTVTELAPFLSVEGLHHVITDVRPPMVSIDGDTRVVARGPWAPLVGTPLDDQREQLLWHLVDLAEQKSGEPWPFPNDRRPATPDDASELTDP